MSYLNAGGHVGLGFRHLHGVGREQHGLFDGECDPFGDQWRQADDHFVGETVSDDLVEVGVVESVRFRDLGVLGHHLFQQFLVGVNRFVATDNDRFGADLRHGLREPVQMDFGLELDVSQSDLELSVQHSVRVDRRVIADDFGFVQDRVHQNLRGK